MIALRGKTEEYFFDEHRPFTRPGKFSTVYKGENSIGEPVIIKKLINGGNKNPFEDKVSHPAFIKTIDVHSLTSPRIRFA